MNPFRLTGRQSAAVLLGVLGFLAARFIWDARPVTSILWAGALAWIGHTLACAGKSRPSGISVDQSPVLEF